jgi:hypothetical protein
VVMALTSNFSGPLACSNSASGTAAQISASPDA